MQHDLFANPSRRIRSLYPLIVALQANIVGGENAMIAPLTPDLGQWTLVQGFAAMTLGGFGSLGGAVAGGILLGIIQKLLGFYLNTVFIEITGYLVPIIVLLLRPQGLFGRRAAVRV